MAAAALALVAGAAATGPARAQDDTREVRAGELVVEPATLMALGFEWYIEGDNNRDAAVAVSYRPAGSGEQWREALPLLRLSGEEIRQPPSFDVVTPNMFAGSVFDLAEDTEYEVRLQLSDPDGTSGETTRTVTVRTRAEPRPATDGRRFHVYPPGHQGEKQEPAFSSLLEAYNTGANGADWSNSFLPRVQPGDTIVMHAGTYSQDRRQYGGRGMGTLFDGTMYLTAKGTAERPIAIVAAGDGEVIIDGGGNHVLFNLQAADHHHFEGLTIRNTDVAFDLGHKRIGGAVGFVLKHSRIEDVGRGVSTDWGGARDFYIADNTFMGRNDPDRLMGWIGRTWNQLPGFPQPLLSEYAIKVFGSGHVIAHNLVANFHDGIDHATYGNPDDWPDTPRDRMPVALDIYNNDIRNVDDNCIEADGAMFNVRVMRNRCFNHAHRALSTQPALGGPIYFIRNIVYNAPEGGALKLTANSAGVILYNNTFLSEVHQMGPTSNVHFRNNLILGQGAWPQVFSTEEFTAYSSSDYNGFGPATAGGNTFAIVRPANGATSWSARRTETTFADLASYAAATGRDRSSVIVDWTSFVRASPPDPTNPTRNYDPADFDFSLAVSSPAVDAGTILPNVSDRFTGRGPDLGAIEAGQPFVVGPREPVG
ncbi:hypothetical protein [Alteraurantiacibacter buctensis]|uniref:Right handed beta helix domain-containing protein n=1 Tax=Alteraurantiacibacter buctensis TaxID=1503981 RepID=A0A844YX93_9SPHN|nr:hypothetical protein [Alteraurantiacibacter buctensis]MXO72965.1 hypothetical protein [Alteraurantiacibacter buctensis]